MVLIDKFPVGLNFEDESDKIQLTNPVDLGESWTVETWLSLSNSARQNLEQNLSEQKLIASDPQQDARFGNSVAVSGNNAIVGAYQEDSKTGAAYIFEFDSSGTWQEKQKLIASDPEVGDLFGRSVAISGNLAIVGADDEDTGGKSAGAAYIFERDDSGTWTEKAKIQASNKGASDNFGYAVAISNNFAIVGAYGEDTGGSNAGSAYIFEGDDSGIWTEKAKIQASDTQVKGYFGNSVAINGNFAIVGAWQQDTVASDAGAAYIFGRDSAGSWTEKQKLVASDGQEKDYFGRSVAISGNLALVGADNQSTGGKSAGAAYLFERDDSGTWTEKQKLQASDKQEWVNFGYSVAINGNSAIIGAYGEDTGEKNVGAAYLFEGDSSGSWIETKKFLANDGEANDNFGRSVAISNNFAIIGALDKDTGVSNAGAAYIFTVADVPAPEPTKQVLLASSNGDSPLVIQDLSQLGTIVDGVFYDSGYNLEQLTPGWHHLTAVAQDTTTKFYLDGQKIADVKQALLDAASDDASRQQQSAKICKTTADISTIGSSTSDPQDLAKLKLAEVRVWNQALSESQITVNSNKVRLTGNEAGLTAYYPLNEATGTEVVDRSNANNGTVTGAGWWCGTVPIDNLDNSVMQFDGADDYIDLGDGVIVGDHFTESAWIYSTSTDNAYHGFLGQQGNKRAPSLWIVGKRVHGDFNQGGRLGILTSNVLFADAWNHVAVTYDGVDCKVYVNGEECFTKNLNNEPASTTPIKYIGKVDNHFKGQIAEVRIWNKTRTREEIQADMYQRLTGNESDLVAYLPLNQIQAEGGTQKVLDLTNNNNHGTIHGATLETSNTLPILGTVNETISTNDELTHKIIQFNGTGNYIEVPYSTTINPEQFTVSCWAKVTGRAGSYRSPITSRSNEKGYIFYAGSNNKWQMWVGNGSSWTTVTGANVVLNTWTNLTGTYDGSKLKFYLNGEFAAELTTSLTINTACPLRIGAGRTESTPNYLFPGEIAEVRIWKTARTESEIKANINQRLTGNESDLVAYFPLDEIQVEGDTQKILDRTSNNHHGIVHGATLESSKTLPIS